MLLSVSAELKIARETTIGSVCFNPTSWTAIGKLVCWGGVSKMGRGRGEEARGC